MPPSTTFTRPITKSLASLLLPTTRNSITAAAHRSRIPLARTMATTTPEKCDWLVIVPDFDGALEKRMAVRPSHLKALTPGVESGFWKMGGATLSEQPAADSPLKIVGSAMVAHAATKEEVLEVLKRDIYADGVWDLEKIQIYPFKTAFRNP